jgi:hypothetical protein
MFRLNSAEAIIIRFVLMVIFVLKLRDVSYLSGILMMLCVCVWFYFFMQGHCAQGFLYRKYVIYYLNFGK